MITFYTPKLENYEKQLVSNIWKNVYRKLQWDSRFKIEMDIFEDKEKAIEILKDWIDKGAFMFSHFNSDYTKFIVFRSVSTDKYLKIHQQELKENGKEK